MSDYAPALKLAEDLGIEVFATNECSLGEGFGIQASWVDFRSQFWLQTTRRFSALRHFHETFGGAIVHVESDVILFPGFDPSLIVGSATQIRFPLYGANLGVASVLALPDAAATAGLEQFAYQKGTTLGPNANDMTILGDLFKEHPERVRPLPSYEEVTGVRLPMDAAELASIFDGASIGMYLGGDDPRNNRGIRKFLNEETSTSLGDPSISAMSFAIDSDQLFCTHPSLGTWLPVMNLHIHSKDLRLFSAPSRTKLLERRIRRAERPGWSIDPWAFGVVVRDGVQRRVFSRGA